MGIVNVVSSDVHLSARTEACVGVWDFRKSLTGFLSPLAKKEATLSMMKSMEKSEGASISMGVGTLDVIKGERKAGARCNPWAEATNRTRESLTITITVSECGGSTRREVID